ncbi:MAG: hypothetical protein ABI045_05255 [Flavobacteriales bacterium]
MNSLKPNMKKSSGLKIIIILLMMINIWYIIYVAIPGLRDEKNTLSGFNLPKYYFSILLLLNVIGAVGGYLIYRFKKLGVYFILTEISLQILIQRIYGYIDTDVLFHLFLLCLGSVSIIPKWKQFS